MSILRELTALDAQVLARVAQEPARVSGAYLSQEGLRPGAGPTAIRVRELLGIDIDRFVTVLENLRRQRVIELGARRLDDMRTPLGELGGCELILTALGRQLLTLCGVVAETKGPST